MANLSFKVVGIDDVTTSSLQRFVSCTTDGRKLYVGSEAINGAGHVWEYNGISWKQITGNLATVDLNISALSWKDGFLYAGTGKGFESYNYGQVWVHNGIDWANTNLIATANFNFTIRKLVWSGRDLFAVGSVGFLWKYSNGTWIEFLSGGVTDSHFSDVVSDGTNIYAATIPFSYFGDGRVIKYNGTSWSEISVPGDWDTTSPIVTCLKIFEGKLHAAVFDDSTGAQVWQYDGISTWTKINTDGFGSVTTFSISAMEVIGNLLVVATESTVESEIWTYSSATGWSRNTISSSAVYSSYMIQTVGSVNYLIGKARKYFQPAATKTTIYTHDERRAKGLHYWPDSPMGISPIGNGRYRFFAANSAVQAITEGTLDDPAELVLDGSVTATDPSTVYAGGTMQGLKSDSSTIDYFGGGPVYRDEATGIIILVTHTEEGYWNPTPADPSYPPGFNTYYRAGLRLVVSTDDGLSFKDCGWIIKSYMEIDEATPPYVDSLTIGSLIAKDGYFYLYYTGELLGVAGNPNLCVARAPISEVITAALGNEISTWTKYYNGSFSQPGLRGLASDLISEIELGIPNAFAVVAYSPILKKFAMLTAQLARYFDPNLYAVKTPGLLSMFVLLSDDGFTWGMLERLTVDSSTIYPSILGPSMCYGLLDSDFYLYCPDRPVNGTNWAPDTALVRYGITSLPHSNSARTFTLGSYSRFRTSPDAVVWTDGHQGDVSSTQTRSRLAVSSDDQKIPIYAVADESEFLNIQIPTRVESLGTALKDLTPFSSSVKGRKVSYHNEVFDTIWVAEGGMVKEKSFGPSQFDVYAEYEIRDITIGEDLSYGTYDDVTHVIVPKVVSVRGEYLYVVCVETFQEKSSYVLKIVKAREPANAMGYLESVTDFQIGIPTRAMTFQDQLEEILTTIAFSEKDPNIMLITTNLGRQFTYRLYFDYYYNDVVTNKIYMLETYPNSKIQVM